MAISERKLAANRRNALLSTGPKTPMGKLRSSRNGLKHGRYSHFNICAAIMILPARLRREIIRDLLIQLDPEFARAVTKKKRRLPRAPKSRSEPNLFPAYVPMQSDRHQELISNGTSLQSYQKNKSTEPKKPYCHKLQSLTPKFLALNFFVSSQLLALQQPISANVEFKFAHNRDRPPPQSGPFVGAY